MVVPKVLFLFDLAEAADTDVLPGAVVQVAARWIVEHAAMLPEDLLDRAVCSVFGKGNILVAAAQRIVETLGRVVDAEGGVDRL